VISNTLTRSTPKHARTAPVDPGHGGFGPWKAPLLLIAAELAVLGYVIRGSFFIADDYQAFGLAHFEGLGPKLLFTPAYGNMAPTERFLHWLSLSIAPLNYGLGEVIILTLTAALLVSLLWALRELRAHPVVVLAAIFIVGSSTIVFYEAFDFDQVTFLFPASSCMLCVMALFVRWIRTGKTWVLVASWVVYGLSFLTQERLLILPVYLVVVRYLVLPYRMPPGGRRKPWADWRIWLPFAAIALGYYAYYRRLAEHSHPDYGTTFTFLRIAGQKFFGALLGLPLQGVPGWVTVIAWSVIVAVLVAVLVASRVAVRRRALLGSTVFFVLAFATNLFAVFQGVGGSIGINGIIGQLQYYLDPIVAFALALGMASSPLASAPDPLDRLAMEDPENAGQVSLRWPLVVGCAVLVALHIALLPFGMSNVLDSQRGQRLAAVWVPTLRSSLSAMDRANKPTSILPLTMPAAFVPSFEAPFQLEQLFLPLLPEWRPSDHGQVTIIGSRGDLESARALNSVTVTGPEVKARLGPPYSGLSSHVNSNGETCFTGTGDNGQFRIVLPKQVDGSQIAVDLHVVAARPFTVTPFLVTPHSQTTLNVSSVTVPAGNHRLLASLSNNPVSVVGFIGFDRDADFCVLGLQVAGVGVISPTHADQCQNVNQYGSPVGTREPCGVAWS
jgi:hypothetical protein